MKRNRLSFVVVVLAGLLVMAGVMVRPGVRAAAPAGAVAGRGAGGAVRKKTDQVRGFSMQLFDLGADKYIAAIDEMADLGCTWMNLSVSARQENVHSEAIAINWLTVPSGPELQRILRHAKERGMGVMFMPIVLLSNSGPKDWRGAIDPPNWDNWFASYTNYMMDMARVATACDVDIFCVGSELLSTEPFRDRWIGTIGQIRTVYKGKLTYSANWDHYEVVTFWDQLDYIGMNNYNELAGSPGATVPQLVKAWGPIKEKILAFGAKQKKPVIITEVGWHNLANTLSQPWNYVVQETPIDHNEQLHGYESFVEAWKGVPKEKFMGVFFWEWWPGAKPTDHGTYSLQGTPALEVVKKWMAGP